MPGPTPLVVVQKALPLMARQLPKLWPLLLESKNRDKLASLAGDLAASSPRRRLAAKLELTSALAETHAGQASTPEEVAQAQDWQQSARRMRIRLDMPIEGTLARRAHRRELRADLAELHRRMSASLGES